MYKKTIKKTAVLLLAFALMMNLTSCGDGNHKDQSITYNLRYEPDSIDPAFAASIQGADVILANFEGLMKLDQNNRAIPGIAASYTKNSDIKYTFHLRNAKWSDGKPVYAEDFEYAWKRALAPETGGEYAYQLYYIKNGEAYNNGQVSSDDVGIRVIDHRTLEVTLESPTPYFLEMVACPSYMPVRKDIILANKDGWSSNPALYIGNGPFKMSSKGKDGSMEFIRNKNYYESSKVRVNKLKFVVVEDRDTYYKAWEDGGIDVIESLPQEAQSQISGSRVTIKPYLGVYFYSFNTKVKPLNNKRVRKALAYAIDRTSIIQDDANNEAIPATGFVPPGMPDADISSNFRNAGGAYFKPEAQIDEARKLLSSAGYPGGAGFPHLTLTYNEGGFHEAIAKTVQHMWKKNLGIDVKLKPQKWDTLQNTIENGSFDIIRQGWIADFADPLAFMSLFVTHGANNGCRYSSAAYDELISAAKVEPDPQKRSSLLHQSESMLMDDMPVLPVYFYSDAMMIKPNIKGIIRSPLGYTYFDRAYVE